MLLKYELNQETISFRIIKILESHLLIIESGFGSQLRTAFISEFLEKIVIEKGKKIVHLKSCKRFKRTARTYSYLLVSIFRVIPLYIHANLVTTNAICHFILTAFIKERLIGTWPDSISSLLAITKDSMIGREIFLKFCLMLTEEIASSQGGNPLNARNADLRDSMRLGDIAILCSFWKEILKSYADGITSHLVSKFYAHLALECFASYASWIDVGLIVDGETLKLIYFLLQSHEINIQLAAADFLAEIVAKGMPANDKISLANYMNLTSVFEAVGQRGILDGFFCKCCRILSNLAVSLGQQIQLATPSLSQSVQEQVVQYICPVLLPHLLRVLQILTAQPRDCRDDQWEEGLAALIPFISNTFEIARSMREQLRSDQIDFMIRFLPLCINLMEFSDDEVISELNEEPNEIRLALMQAFDSVLWLQGHATFAMLSSLTNGQVSLGRCELLARLTLRIPEGMRGQPCFTISINGESRLTPISELITWTIERIPERFPQLIPLICDVLVRYSSSSYLDVFPDRIDSALRLLMRLLEMRGFKEVDCEKMLKFVKNLKGKLSGYAVILLTALQQQRGTLHLSSGLYEIAGLSVASIDPRSVPMEGLTASLLQGALETSMRLETAITGIECLGCFAKGFMTDSCLDPSIVRSWYREYCNGFLLAQLRNNNSSEYLNSLVAFSQRIIPLLQVDSVPIIKELAFKIIKSDAESCEGISSVESMSQLLPLLSASLFKLRDQFACPEVLGQVWSILLPRVKDLLNRPIQGTDDLYQNLTLSKAWLSFLHALSTSNGMNCTLAQRNPLTETTIMTIIERTSNVNSGNSADVIGLLRSLCGVISRCQVHLSRDFVNCRLLPLLFHRILPSIFQSLDPSSRKNLASLPAALLNLLQDFLLMLRALVQQGNLNEEWTLVNGVEMVRTDVKESRSGLVNYFMSITGSG